MLSLSPLSTLPPSLYPPFLTPIQCTQPVESEGRSRNRNEGIHDVLSLSFSLTLSLSFILSRALSLSLSMKQNSSRDAFRTENLYIINGDKWTSIHDFNHVFCYIKGACILKNIDLKILCDIIDYLCNSEIYIWHICNRLLLTTQKPDGPLRGGGVVWHFEEQFLRFV